MTRRKVIAFAVASCFSIASTPSANLAQTASPGKNGLNLIRIGVVRSRKLVDGAGCSLQLPADYKKHNERYILLSDSENNAVMNIDGKDTNLKLVSQGEPKGDLKRGDRFTSYYGTKGTKVQVDFLVTRVCDPNDESCEVTYYDATITVSRGINKQGLKVKGLCGT
jgi:hypothetical protein